MSALAQALATLRTSQPNMPAQCTYRVPGPPRHAPGHARARLPRVLLLRALVLAVVLHDASIASTSSAPHPAPRPNEHLAVLLPKQLWKPDSHAAHCDNFYCRVPFAVFERRHHCRKCGGVFCAPCTARTTSLLDASNLAFLHPPRNTPLAAFESPASPIITARVCDDCFDQIHGVRSPELPPAAPRRANSLLSSPIALWTKSPRPSAPSSPISASPETEPPSPMVLARAPLPHLQPLAHAPQLARPVPAPLPAPARPRALAAGGGRWEPAPEVPDPGTRVPIIGGKAPEERRRRSNPVIRDGDFQYRFPAPEPEPIVLERAPLHLSTF
ncbi:FYVE zinc finger-domain-containing protein [Mycena vulgaris]|nr:FYVE zinc finger-domain-containing protein [Mycena vulgaris]